MTSRGGSGGTGGGGISGIEPLEGYCQILLTLRDSAGDPISNGFVNCKDGSKWYNYRTNSDGQALFSTNNGVVNFYASNNVDSNVIMADQLANNIYNFQSPVGTVQAADLYLQKQSSFNWTTGGTWNIIFRTVTKITGLNVVGGGGGGGACDVSSWGRGAGGGGGA